MVYFKVKDLWSNKIQLKKYCKEHDIPYCQNLTNMTYWVHKTLLIKIASDVARKKRTNQYKQQTIKNITNNKIIEDDYKVTFVFIYFFLF